MTELKRHRLHIAEQTVSRLATAVVLIAASLLIGGCNIVGPAAYLIAGPGMIEAEHQLADRPTVVFIDDRENVVNPVSLRRAIADKVSQDLMVKRVVRQTISPHDAMAVASRRDRHDNVMPIDAIGRAVGAEQIIFIEMLVFQDSEGYERRPIAACRVRVIDVENRTRLYPPSDSVDNARLVQVRMREVTEDAYRTRGTRHQISVALADELGDTIARLFYRHERDLGGRLEARKGSGR
jgi:hypothetical protein